MVEPEYDNPLTLMDANVHAEVNADRDHDSLQNINCCRSFFSLFLIKVFHLTDSHCKHHIPLTSYVTGQYNNHGLITR